MNDEKMYLVSFTYTDSDGVERKAIDYFYGKELILNSEEEKITVNFNIGDVVRIDLSGSNTDDDRIMNSYDSGIGIIIQIYDKNKVIVTEEGNYYYEKKDE